MLKRVLAGVVVVLTLTGASAAGSLEDANAAYHRGDYEAALGLWLPLAELGNAKAQFNLGRMYHNGEGVPQDYAEAVRWYRLAAAQCDAKAQTNLGVMYAKGEGVPQDDAEVVKWFQRAAEEGYATAQYNLGVIYATGKGVLQDDVLGHLWLNVAAAQGDAKAAEDRDIVASRLTPDQLAEAQRLAREWLAAH